MIIYGWIIFVLSLAFAVLHFIVSKGIKSKILSSITDIALAIFAGIYIFTKEHYFYLAYVIVLLVLFVFALVIQIINLIKSFKESEKNKLLPIGLIVLVNIANITFLILGIIFCY